MNPQDQPSGPSQDRHEFRPGQTISPRDGSSPATSPPAPADASSPSLPAPTAPAPTPAQSTPEPEQHLFHAEETAQPQTEVMSSQAAQMNTQMVDNGREVTWTALEFIAHQKTGNWYVAMIFISAIIAAIVYVWTRDVFNTVVVIIAAIIFGVAAARPPREMHYSVDDHGIEIGRRFYPYSEFRSFSIAEDGPLRSLVFMPLKRFMPQLSIYYDPADEERIGEVLSAHLPMHEHRHELTDRLMKRIRF